MPSGVAVIFFRCVLRHVSFGNIAGKRGSIARAGVAISAAARALQEEAFSRVHLITARRRRLVCVAAANSDDKARALSGFSSGKTGRRKTALVIAAHNSRI